MHISLFDYHLPKELIAQEPVKPRDSARLMVLKRGDGNIEDVIFSDIIEYLNPGDTIVLNDTKVIKARLIGFKERTHGKVEVLLLKEEDKYFWESLINPSRKVKEGDKILFHNTDLQAVVGERTERGTRRIKFNYSGDFHRVLEKIGRIPLPPYIKKELKEEDLYQTVYAEKSGSVAAPTAGLHMTSEVLNKIRVKGIKIANVTLHISLDTFRPIKEENIFNHKMYSEYFEIPEESANIINNTDGRIIAVGTTTVRILESAVEEKSGLLLPKSGTTSLYIYPGYKFKIVDILITNFHLPKSTVLILVCAFAGRDLIFKAYSEAIKRRYRFLSFGDAMLIL